MHHYNDLAFLTIRATAVSLSTHLSHFCSAVRDGHGAVVGEDGQLEVEGGAGAAVGVSDRQEGDASLLPQVVLKIELKTNYNFCFYQRRKIR